MTARVRDFVPADVPAVLAVWRETGLASPQRADTPATIARRPSAVSKISSPAGPTSTAVPSTPPPGQATRT